MPHFPAPIASRLPAVGTTIFTVMSRLAQECGALNLSQGFPDFNAEDELFERVAHHMRAGRNQYAPMAGVAALREAVAAKIAALYGTAYDPESEITVTAGATQALFTAVAAAVTPRTRMIMINTPHNPTGTVWSAQDMVALEALTRGSGIVIVADEVYEHILFDGRRHESVARYPGLAERSVIVSSFGKTYHITGWKVGYVAAPRELMAEFRKVHQFNVFTVNTPVQYALADYMTEPERSEEHTSELQSPLN